MPLCVRMSTASLLVCLFVSMFFVFLPKCSQLSVFTVAVSLIFKHNLQFHQSSSIVLYFIFLSIHWGRFNKLTSSSMTYTYLSVARVSRLKYSWFCFFCFAKCELLFLSVVSYHQLSPLVLTLTSIFHLTSFSYNDKVVRDVGLTCRCHLSNIMPDSIFNDWWRQVMIWKFFKIKGVVLLFTVSCKRKCSLITLASVNVRKT